MVDSVKTLNGIAAASVKTVNGIAVASVKTWNGVPWAAAGGFITATGGTITTDGDYKVHTFTASGTFEVTSGSGNVWYLVIAGGGGGGRGATNQYPGAGGGAGGFRTNAVYDYAVSVNAYTVTIGGRS